MRGGDQFFGVGTLLVFELVLGWGFRRARESGGDFVPARPVPRQTVSLADHVNILCACLYPRYISTRLTPSGWHDFGIDLLGTRSTLSVGATWSQI